ncbi:MAG: GFA family protein [Bauldia sp.]
MTEAKTPSNTHEGGCHCGAVRYRAEVAVGNAMSCNCSRCQKLGWLLTFIPATQFTLVSGADMLTDYRFNTGNIAHLFCKKCGIESFGRGKGADGMEMVAINLRCLDGVEPDELTITKVNGRIR